MKKQTVELTPQEKLNKAKFTFKLSLVLCSVLSAVIIAGIVCLLVLTDDIYAPVILAVALAFGWVGEFLIVINPAYKQIKELEAKDAASENTENFN